MYKSWTLSGICLVLAFLLCPFPSVFIPSPIAHYRTLLFASVKITTSVADLRASRGDFAGANRTRFMARKMEFLQELNVLKVGLSLGRNYLMRNNTDKASEVSVLMSALRDLARLSSKTERIDWVRENGGRILTLFMSLVEELREWAQLMEVVEIMQQEAKKGKFLDDCLELLASNSKAFTQFINPYAATPEATTEEKPQNHEPYGEEPMYFTAKTEEKPQNHEPVETPATKEPMSFTEYTLLAVLIPLVLRLISTMFCGKTTNPTRHARRKPKRAYADR